MFCDLEAVFVMGGVVSNGRVHTQLASSFFLSEEEQHCASEQRAGEVRGASASLLFCNIMPYMLAVIPSTFF